MDGPVIPLLNQGCTGSQMRGVGGLGRGSERRNFRIMDFSLVRFIVKDHDDYIMSRNSSKKFHFMEINWIVYFPSVGNEGRRIQKYGVAFLNRKTGETQK